MTKQKLSGPEWLREWVRRWADVFRAGYRGGRAAGYAVDHVVWAMPRGGLGGRLPRAHRPPARRPRRPARRRRVAGPVGGASAGPGACVPGSVRLPADRSARACWQRARACTCASTRPASGPLRR
jgi:hypothetical protein